MNINQINFPASVTFGKDTFNQLASLLSAYSTILIIGSEHVEERINQLKAELPNKSIRHFDKVVQHVPQSLVNEIMIFDDEAPADVIIPIGGGATIGLAKALALATEKPIIAVPTTFSGSEQTTIWGITNENNKQTGKSDLVKPVHVIYDTNLTATLHLSFATTSAMSAMPHLIEAIYAEEVQEGIKEEAVEGLNALKEGVKILGGTRRLTEEANEMLLYGAYVSGKCLNTVEMSLHHQIAHILGGKYDLDHSLVHTVLQAFVLNYQWSHLPAAIQKDFVMALGHQPATVLQQLAAKAGAPTDLKSIGFKKEFIRPVVEEVLEAPYPSVAPLEQAKLVDMLMHAYEGSLEG